MKALTVKQPWAAAIIHGGKDVENRSQLFAHRGLLAIHAGKDVESDGWTDARVRDVLWPLHPNGRDHLWSEVVNPRGVIVGVVDVVDSHRHASGTCCDSRWAEQGCAHMVLANPRPLAEPVPARGMPGLWSLAVLAERAVRRQLPAAERAS